MIFLAQIIGGLAISLWVVSIQNKERKNILLFQGVANLLYIIEYSLLNAYSAASMNLISTIRCFIFRKVDEKKLHKLTIIFIGLILILGLLTYNGILSLIPILISIIYTISSSNKNAKYNRIAILIAAFIWIYYNYKVEAYITIVGNIFEIISGILSLIRFKDE